MSPLARDQTTPIPHDHGLEDIDAWEEILDDIDDSEAWVELGSENDFPGLVAYFEARVARYPDNESCVKSLGRAYVLNGDYERSIELLSGLHDRQPDDEDVQDLLLEALFAIGKNENDFDWRQDTPPVIRLSREILDGCHAYLKPKRKARCIEELYYRIRGEGYCAFSEEDLLDALRKDDRFLVDGDVFDSAIRARRQGRRLRRNRR